MRNHNGAALRSRRTRLLAAIMYVVGGLLITGFLIGVKLLVEHSSWGRDNELWVFGKLQGTLSQIDTDNPVVLLDISGLAGGKLGQPTSRKALTKIIDALADQNPRAIAVDVDLSPYSEGYVVPDEDPDFFDFCLDVRNKRKVPIFLAVGRTKSAPPEAWLGEEKYAPLAVAVAVNKEDTHRMPLWVRAKGASQKLRMMSYALALEYRKHLPEASRWISWAVEKNVEEPPGKTQPENEGSDDSDLVYAAHLINFSKLDLLKQSAQKDTSAESVRNTGSNYDKKLVILGDVSMPLDVFPVPGRQLNEGGVLLQASATYTLIREPLFEFTPKIRRLLDTVMAVFIIALVALIRYRNPDNSYWMGKQAIFIYSAIAVVILFGVMLVRYAGVMWLDFLLVSGALFLHPKLEHLIHWILSRPRTPREPPKTPGPAAPVVTAAICVSAAALMSMSMSAAYAQGPESLCQQRIAAVAVRITTTRKGACWVKENKDADPDKLAATDAGKKQFRAGQRLSCDKSCTMVIRLCGTGREQPVTEHPPKWFPVYNAFKDPEHNDRFKANAGRIANSFAPRDPRRSWPEPRRGQGWSGNVVFGIANQRSNAKAPTKQEEQELEARLAVLLDKGNASRAAKDYPASEELFNEARQLNPSDGRASWGLGNVYADQQKWKEAEEAYRNATYSMLDPELYLALGFVLLQPREGVVSAEKIEDAERYLWHAALFEPENPAPFDLLYRALEKRQANTNELERAYKHALKLNSRSYETCFRFSQLLRTLGRTDEADKYLGRADQSARTATELLAVAFEWESQLRYEKAERSLERSAVLAPNDPNILFGLGRVQMLRKHYSQAVQSLQLAAKLNPNGFEPNYLLGVAQLRVGDLKEAERALDQVAPKLATGTDDVLALAFALASVGDAYASSGNLTDAIRLYERALHYDAEDQETKDKLSEAHIRLGY